MATAVSSAGDDQTDADPLLQRRQSSQETNDSPKLHHTKSQVSAIVHMMRLNVDRVMERDRALLELSDRTENLDQTAEQFKDTAGKLKNVFWWKNIKTTIIIVIFVIVAIVIVIAVVVSKLKS